VKATTLRKDSNVDGFEIELELSRDELIRLLVGETIGTGESIPAHAARALRVLLKRDDPRWSP
jgi:hypothetical protein